MTADWPDDNPSAHRALAIYGQGVPLARKPNSVVNSVNTILPSLSATLASGAIIDQPSFQAAIVLQAAAAGGALPFGKVKITWADAASGISSIPDVPVLPASNGSASAFLITGPSRMDALSIELDNLDPGVTLSYSFGLSQTSHAYDRLRVQETTGAVVAGFTRPGGNPGMGMLANISATIPVSSAISRLALTWAGKAILSVDNEAGTVPVTVRLMDPGVILGGSPLYQGANSGIFEAVVVAAGSAINQEVSLPPGPVVINEENLSATVTPTPTVLLQRVDH